MKKALIFTTSMGHFSLAKAVEERLKKAGWKTKIHFSRFGPELTSYRYLANFLSPIWRWWFKFSQSNFVIKISRFWLSWRKKEEIKKAINEFKPNLVVSTYFIYNWNLANLKDKFHYQFLNLVADPRTIHRATVSAKADFNLVYDQAAVELLKNWQIEEEKIVPIGWMVGEKFYRADRENGKDDFFSILVGAGSWGALSTLKVLPVFLNLPQKTRLILVAGDNKLLYQIYRLFKFGIERKILKPKQELAISVFKFSRKMDQLLRQVDLVIGKAGPNFLFEAVAAGKPFLAVSWVPGQEEGNLEIIEEKKLGWVVKDRRLLPDLLKKIMTEKDFYQSALENIRKEREINRRAGEKIIRLLADLS